MEISLLLIKRNATDSSGIELKENIFRFPLSFRLAGGSHREVASTFERRAIGRYMGSENKTEKQRTLRKCQKKNEFEHRFSIFRILTNLFARMEKVPTAHKFIVAYRVKSVILATFFTCFSAIYYYVRHSNNKRSECFFIRRSGLPPPPARPALAPARPPFKPFCLRT